MFCTREESPASLQQPAAASPPVLAQASHASLPPKPAGTKQQADGKGSLFTLGTSCQLFLALNILHKPCMGCGEDSPYLMNARFKTAAVTFRRRCGGLKAGGQAKGATYHDQLQAPQPKKKGNVECSVCDGGGDALVGSTVMGSCTHLLVYSVLGQCAMYWRGTQRGARRSSHVWLAYPPCVNAIHQLTHVLM